MLRWDSAGIGGGLKKNGHWVAYLYFRDERGRVVRRLKRGFAVNKYGFEQAKALAIDAVRHHDPTQKHEMYVLAYDTQKSLKQPP
jgi:hypothetical protein